MTYDFGNDDLGKILNAHFRVEERFPGIHVALPYNEWEKGPRTPSGQARILVEGAKRGAKLGFWRTVIWDTITNTAYALKNEYARNKVNKDESSKMFTVDLGENFLHNVPGVNWRDNGMAQDQCYYTIRDGLLTAPEPFHLWILGHEVAKEDAFTVGMDAGGPSSAPKFPAGQFMAFLHIREDAGVRRIATKPYKVGANEYTVTFKLAPGTRLSVADDKGFVVLPDGDFAGNVAIHAEMMRALGMRYVRAGLFGKTNAGKSSFVSAFLGLPDTKPALVVMSDNQADLPSWWAQVKAPAVNDKE